MPAAPRGMSSVRAASGPYPAELSASKPKIGIPAETPTCSARASSDARGRPSRKSRKDMMRFSYNLADLHSCEFCIVPARVPAHWRRDSRSEEHTSELQSRGHLVCRLLLEKKNKKKEH